ncbi:hypothetical protein Phum_PHUM066660 [Pediculus humanus corporis]|uniref:Uncharacterized protein n=1 Tax=Pediculus humanus subsp. corporis TaxID=121224 RepID=E0VBQ7_PEDHC|nr:uncharacterized protein Phum_PHUM066660 [Pediculus humanus corporis]EEB10813.1 hypothetical protein Phum_PHUM066660 [Pediculus humanus corporis]
MEFTTRENSDDYYKSKYCLTNPLNNVPWARENAGKNDDEENGNKQDKQPETNRFDEPTEPDLTTWAALFLENNPSEKLIYQPKNESIIRAHSAFEVR